MSSYKPTKKEWKSSTHKEIFNSHPKSKALARKAGKKPDFKAIFSASAKANAMNTHDKRQKDYS